MSQVNTNRAIRDALEANPELYPAETVCAECGNLWMAHKGLLCPMRGSAQHKQESLLAAVQAGVLPVSVLTFKWNGLTLFRPLHEGSDLLVAV